MSHTIVKQELQVEPRDGDLKLQQMGVNYTNSKDDGSTQSHQGRHQVVRQKWYQWFSPTDTPEERRLILKLDALIMIFVFLAYWAKVLDQSATSAAYVSGMKEDLKLFGNELNYINTTYMVGFITLQIPLTLLVCLTVQSFNSNVPN
jgi:hypothetical protein